MASHVRLFLETREPTAPLIALLRRYTGKGMNDLRQAIMARQPFLDMAPHERQHSDVCKRIAEMLDELEARGVRYAAEVDGVRRDPQHLRNILQSGERAASKPSIWPTWTLVSPASARWSGSGKKPRAVCSGPFLSRLSRAMAIRAMKPR